MHNSLSVAFLSCQSEVLSQGFGRKQRECDDLFSSVFWCSNVFGQAAFFMLTLLWTNTCQQNVHGLLTDRPWLSRIRQVMCVVHGLVVSVHCQTVKVKHIKFYSCSSELLDCELICSCSAEDVQWVFGIVHESDGAEARRIIPSARMGHVDPLDVEVPCKVLDILDYTDYQVHSVNVRCQIVKLKLPGSESKGYHSVVHFCNAHAPSRAARSTDIESCLFDGFKEGGQWFCHWVVVVYHVKKQVSERAIDPFLAVEELRGAAETSADVPEDAASMRVTK